MASKPSMTILPVLLCVALALLMLGTLPGSSFLSTASLRAGANPQVRELSCAQAEPRKIAQGQGSALPAVGLAVVTGLLAAAAAKTSRLQRRALVPGSWNDDPYMPGGTTVAMTVEEEQKWMDEKCVQLEALMPMTDEEFEDEIAELYWHWGKHLIPYRDKMTGVGRPNAEKARIKLNKIRKQPEFWKKLRLFKPLVLRHPTLLKHFGTVWTRPRRLRVGAWESPHDIEDDNFKMNASYLANEEKIAGFSYQQFLEETNGNKFDKWNSFEIGDIVPGKVMALNESGAFVDIGAKTWALLPLENASLRPASSMKDAGINIGMEIDAQIVDLDTSSKMTGNGRASQIILSTLDIQRVSAWDLVTRTINAEEGTNPIWKVTVLRVEAAWGATVMTSVGLQGYIPNRELANKVGDAALVGTTIEVNIIGAVEENKDILQPNRPAEFPLIFSYKNIATKALSSRLKEGMVVEAKITDIKPTSIDMEVEGYPCAMTKVEISAAKTYEIADVFRTGEIIKVYVLSTLEKDGSIKFSTRALERKRGEIIRNKAKVFANAEETAKMAFEKFSEAKQKLAENLASALGEDRFGGLFDEGTDSKKGKSMSSLLGDDDSDAEF
eukprot:TRINITY_DN88413_c0_g1_i1.p1 TRINITY_DN88413_c0_g1~~TRINITY_DN88413_c0_g1_i1.p1  ORF type:complete len:654 (-),score=138.15 TRINITY_DN88413_c0_g1_i1:40-1872(-)